MIRYSDFYYTDFNFPRESFVYIYYKLPDGSLKNFYFKLDDVDVFYKDKFVVVSSYCSSDPEGLREINYYFVRKNIILYMIHNFDNEVI